MWIRENEILLLKLLRKQYVLLLALLLIRLTSSRNFIM